MTFLQAMQDRYTTKVYDATKKVSHKQIQELAEILHLSPSSINSQPWKFMIIGNQELKEELAPYSKHNDRRVRDCSHLIVFTKINNTDLFEKQLAKLPATRLTYFQEKVKPLGKEYISNWFTNQVYISLGVLLTACANMNIDATPMEGIVPEQYDNVLGVTNYNTLFAACIGYRSADDFNDPAKAPKRRVDFGTVIEFR